MVWSFGVLKFVKLSWKHRSRHLLQVGVLRRTDLRWGRSWWCRTHLSSRSLQQCSCIRQELKHWIRKKDRMSIHFYKMNLNTAWTALYEPHVQLLEGEAGGVLCATGADQTGREEAQVVWQAPVKPCVDLWPLGAAECHGPDARQSWPLHRRWKRLL